MQMNTRRRFRDHSAPTMGRGISALAAQGRAGDTEVGHLTPGEVVVPKRVWQADPGLRQRATSAMRQAGLNPSQFIVGHPQNSMNPMTGAREFADLVYTDRGWVSAGTGQAADFSQDSSFASTGTYSSPPPTAPPRQSNAMSAAAPDNRNWGADSATNQELARITGYTGDFGTGGFSTYMQGANDVQKQNAAQYLTEQGRGQRIDWNTGMVAPQDNGADNQNPTGSFGYSPTGQGENPNNRAANQELAKLGYTGEFGNNGFNNWINTQSPGIQQQAANILGAAGQPERIGAWGGNGFLNESPYVNGTVPVSYVTPPAPPGSGPTQDLGPGFNTFDFGTGQGEIQNLKAYFDKYGQIPVASGFTPETNSSFGIYDPRADFGGSWDPTYSMLAGLKPEEFAALATAIGVDPNSRGAWQAVEGRFGQQTLDYGSPVYRNGVYQGLDTGGTPRTVLSPLESGTIRVGTGPNTVDIPLADIYSGKVNLNAVEMALSAGYDPNGMEGTMNTLQAADQILRELPHLRNTPWNSAEYNTIRKPLEQAVPGFNAQVANRISRQQSQGRQIPGGNTIGPTDLGQVLSGIPSAGATTTTGASGTTGSGVNRAANAVSAPSATSNGQSITGYSGDPNAPGYDRGWQDTGFYQTRDGVYQDDQGVLMIPQGNGLFLDSMYGFLRNAQGIIVDSSGRPIGGINNLAGGHSDPWRVFGSSGAMGMMGQFAGVDLRSLNDGNNTPIVGNYGGKTGPTPITSKYARDLRDEPWATSIYNREAGGTGGPAGGPGGGPPPTTNTGTNTNTGGTTNPGTNGTTTTGTGLTPGAVNPFSMPINFFLGGMPTTGTNTGTTPQQSTVDPLSWLSLLNLGYGQSTYGYPTYQSSDPGQGGLNYLTPNSQTVEFRSSFGY